MNKWFLITISVIGLGVSGLIFKTCSDNSDLLSANDQLNQQLMQANLAIGKAHTEFGNADKARKELDKALQEALKANKELLTAYGILKAKLNVQGGGPIPIVHPEPVVVTVPAELDLEEGSLYLANTTTELELLGPKLGVSFSDHRMDAIVELDTNPELHFLFSYRLHLSVKGQLVQTIGPTGAVNFYIQLWETLPDGETGNAFELTEFNVLVNDTRKDHFFPWAPHLDLAAIVGWNGTAPQYGASLGVSFMGYGLTDNDLSWRFLRLGVTLSNQNVGLDFEPFAWNLGGPLPLVSNLWIGPFVSWTPINYWGGGLMLGVVL